MKNTRYISGRTTGHITNLTSVISTRPIQKPITYKVIEGAVEIRSLGSYRRKDTGDTFILERGVLYHYQPFGGKAIIQRL